MSPGPFFGLRGGGGASFTRKSVAFRSNRWTSPTNRSRMRSLYAEALFRSDAATLDDCSEAVTTLEEVARTARRVFGGTHPLTTEIERELRNARAVLARAESA